MGTFASSLASQAVDVCVRIVCAIVAAVVGRLAIRAITTLLHQSTLLNKVDGAVKTFSLSCVQIGLYLLLIVSIIGIVGVPLTSIAALITSVGVAIGLGFQGALANLAGGIMLIIFKPFKLGDYIEATGITGIAEEINLFYTIIMTMDNKRVTVPNGTLMNTNITDYTAYERRRIELLFTCARTENPSRVQDIIKNVLLADERVLSSPEPPLARISGSTNEAYEFTVRAWCRTEIYLSVYFDLIQHITEALAEEGISSPATRVVTNDHLV